MSNAVKDFILLCVVVYAVWILLVTLWYKIPKRRNKRSSPYPSPLLELTTEQILGKSKFNLKEELAKREKEDQEKQLKEQERLDKERKDEERINARALEIANKIIQELKLQQHLPPQEEPPTKYPRVVPVEELDAVFSNEEVLPDYSMPDKFDKMMAERSGTTVGELDNVAKVLTNRNVTTNDEQQTAAKVITKIDNTVLLDQMLSQIDGATQYAAQLIEKHYAEQLTPHPSPQTENFNMDKYLNY